MSKKEQSGAPKEQKLYSILRDDIHRVDFKRTFSQEFEELEKVMLTEERRERLQGMKQFKRWIVMGWWLLRSLIRKLTPARRLMFVLGLILCFFQAEINNREINYGPLGVTILVLILMLELKDKLLAHEELHAGQAVQQALMPERSPHVPGWDLWLFTRSANEVGGDLVDFAVLGERGYGVMLGDVAGKGLSAALLTAKLQATIKAIASDCSSLDALGKKLNEIYCRDGLRKVFASLVFVEFQQRSAEVRLLNAGHIPPVVVRNGKVETLQKGGPALGIIRHAEHSEQLLMLEKDEFIVVYSDGLTEAQNSVGGFYGEERLISQLERLSNLPVQNLGEMIVADVDRFLQDIRPNDDLSIVIIKRIA